MPVCKGFCRRFLFAEQSDWTQREHVEEMSVRETMKVKRVPDEGDRGKYIDKEDTLETIIGTVCAKCYRDLQNTRAETCAQSEIDR